MMPCFLSKGFLKTDHEQSDQNRGRTANCWSRKAVISRGSEEMSSGTHCLSAAHKDCASDYQLIQHLTVLYPSAQ